MSFTVQQYDPVAQTHRVFPVSLRTVPSLVHCSVMNCGDSILSTVPYVTTWSPKKLFYKKINLYIYIDAHTKSKKTAKSSVAVLTL